MADPILDLDSDVHLRPVIELSPGHFGSCPDVGPGPWTDEQVDRYWRACLAESGIVDLRPIQPRSWLVFASDIAAPFPLNKILEAHLEMLGRPADLDELSPLEGGFALCRGAQPLLLPSCCGDLRNLADWKVGAAQREDSPAQLWVGHPWFSVWFADGKLHIREEQEQGMPERPRTVRLWPSLLEAAIAGADREVDDLRKKLVTLLDAMPGSGSALALANHLVGRGQ